MQVELFVNERFFNKLVPMDAIAGIKKLVWLYCNMLFERQKLWGLALRGLWVILEIWFVVAT